MGSALRRAFRFPTPRRWLAGIGLCVLLSSAATWIGAIYDHPISTAIVDGMNTAECAAVGQLRAGSLLTSPIPEHDVCMPLFVYRASYADAASNVTSYRAWILEQRVAEFWRLIGYVLLLSAAISAVVAVSMLIIRRLRR
ncbi:hypothetical protein C5615_33830 [Burkholderia cepacia]|uniref:Transmembrane protein n=1 Tax=Burkholderia cepacia TaxID=292 RepID=A0A2S8I610_BURCE|nr:hypothetical protein [Burkholderia cepacia]PQP10240.1 hypothetical protein C5615_33830 [Burkholderia cepacia]